MLEALERLAARAAPARRRRLARAAHAADEPAHEHRGAGARGRRAAGRASATRLLRDVVAQLEELTALVGDLVELARDERAASRSCEDVRLDRAGRGGGRARGAALRPRPRVRRASCEPTLVRRRRRRGWSAPSPTCSTTRRSGARRARRSRCALRDGELTVRDHGPGHRRRGPAARVRPLLPRAARRAAARLRPRPGDRAPGRRGARRQRQPRRRRGGGALLRLRLPASQAIPRFG